MYMCMCVCVFVVLSIRVGKTTTFNQEPGVQVWAFLLTELCALGELQYCELRPVMLPFPEKAMRTIEF